MTEIVYCSRMSFRVLLLELTAIVSCESKLTKLLINLFNFSSLGLEDPKSEFYKQGQSLFNLNALGLLKLLFTASSPDLSRKMHLRANVKEPSDFLHKVFVQTIKEREAGGVQRNDFVQLLLKVRETVSLSVDEMAAEAFIFFVGGFETSKYENFL